MHHVDWYGAAVGFDGAVVGDDQLWMGMGSGYLADRVHSHYECIGMTVKREEPFQRQNDGSRVM